MLLRAIARPLLAGIFIAGGVEALRDPDGHAELVKPAMEPALDTVSGVVPVDRLPATRTLVQIDGAVKVGAGLLLAFGWVPRLAAGALAATVIPTTVFGHRFWEIDDPERRGSEQAHFLKNLGLLGGLLLASADTEGKPSLAWRARRARRTSAQVAELFHHDVTEKASDLARRAGELGDQVSLTAGRLGETVSGGAERVGTSVSSGAARVGPKAERLGSQVAQTAGRVGAQAAEVAGRVSAQAADVAGQVGAQAVETAGRVGAQAGDVAGRVKAEAGSSSRRRSRGRKVRRTVRRQRKRLGI